MGETICEQAKLPCTSSVAFHHPFSTVFSIFFVAFPAPIVISFLWVGCSRCGLLSWLASSCVQRQSQFQLGERVVGPALGPAR